jgi:transketolase
MNTKDSLADSDTESGKQTLTVNTIRALGIDAIERAQSGHPGIVLGAAVIGHTIFHRFLKFNPANPSWPDRDRFVLSAGHGSMLLYALLHLTGYDVSLEDLKAFRQLGSKTPGHPEYGLTPGVETTTGPLGQGIANAVGMAMAERFLASMFNTPEMTLVDHRTYVLAGDGDIMEGVCYEAAALAGHLGLGKLTVVYDANDITIEGPLSLTSSTDTPGLFEALGWQVLHADGLDSKSLTKALNQATSQDSRPTLVIAKTRIGFGSPNKEGKASAHGAPLGKEEIAKTKEALGYPHQEAFFVHESIRAHMEMFKERGHRLEQEWENRFTLYREAYPKKAELLKGLLPQDALKNIPVFDPQIGSLSTREASGMVLNAIASHLPTLMGGAADLAPSSMTYLKGMGDFQKDNPSGRNVRFGVREHAMGGVLNGLALHGGILPFGGTFLVFSDYMRPAIRLAALMRLPVVYPFSHDSFHVGEDGPTHQPIEHIASLRLIPGLSVIRPADANETAQAWSWALRHREGPVALILSRQKLPILKETLKPPQEGLERGGYILSESENDPPRILLVATGSEVHLAMLAHLALKEEGVASRVVSMPCLELFLAQPKEYQERVLPSTIKKRIVIEAGVTSGWPKVATDEGVCLTLDRFGASGNAADIAKSFGFSLERVLEAARSLL